MNETLPRSEFAYVDAVINVNFDPHPFTVGPEHVVYASDHCGGMLGEDVMRKIPCANGGHRLAGIPRCNLPYEAHKSDKVAFIKLTRNASKEEMQEWLKSIVPWMESEKIDGVTFVETKEKWRIE